MGVVVRQKIKGKGKPWWVFVSHDGKRTSRKVGDKRAAQAVARKIEKKLALGAFNLDEDKKSEPSFKDYAKSWIKTTVPATCKPSTLRDYKDILNNHIYPVFEDVKINEITRGKIKDFLLSKINDGYAKSTVSHMKDAISGVLNKALDDEVVPANLALNIGKITNRNKKESFDPLTLDELQLLLAKVKKHYSSHYVLFLLLARTGMRIGEALALQWGDIDFNGRFINVSRSIVRGKISTPKSGKSRRVDMSRQLSSAFKEHELESKKKGMKLGLGGLPEFLFTNEKGRVIDKDNWRRRVFAKALEKAELRKIRIHDLRHTYATLRIAKGDNIADVSKQLGHHSVKLTMDVYYHWVPGAKKREVDGLDDVKYRDEDNEAETV